MTPTLTEDDLEPFTSSGLAWRWRDPKYDVLPDTALQGIRSIKKTKSEEFFRPSIDIDNWVRARPAREIDTEATTDAAVSEWLLAGGVGDEMVIASWSEQEAIYLPFVVFSTYWSSFCYPASDDVTIWPADERWGLSYSHRGVLYWRSREPGPLA